MERKTNPFQKFWQNDKALTTTLFVVISAFLSVSSFRVFYVQGKLFAALCAVAACVAAVVPVFHFITKKIGSLHAFAEKLRSQKEVLLSLLLGFVLVFFVFAVYALSPLGEYTSLRMDLYHQYGPLFAELYDRVAQGKSLLYSWNSAGGSGFLGNFFNYLSSPFTLLIFWFSRKEVVTTGISFVIFAKCIASAGTFSYYLKKRSQKSGYSICAFALLYAFSAYFIAYFWNVMWLDAVAVFPLIILGIERIIDNSRGKLYCAALIYAFLTNYYMAYMICIFSVLYFFVYYLSRYSFSALYVPKTRDLPRFSYLRQSRLLCSGLRFAFMSILASLCCAAVLLPIYRVLSASSATNGNFPSDAKSYFDIYEFLASHLSALDPTIRSSGENIIPNVYCGVITVLLFPLYLMNKRIGWKEKVAHFLLLVLLFTSFNVNILNYIWHGFHFPNDLPYRFSFMYSFILLLCAFKVFEYIKDYNYRTLVIVGGVLIFVCAALQRTDNIHVDDFSIYATIAFIVVYTIIICASIGSKLTKVMTSVVLCCAVLCEVLICDVPKFEFGVTKTSYNSDYQQYRKDIDTVYQNDNGFYRIELNDIPTTLRMSPCWYNYEGINCFSSMANEDYANMQFSLGMFSNTINSFIYHNQTPIYNLMFNIKYIIDNNNPCKLNEDYFTFVRGNKEHLSTFRNNYESSIGFCVNREVLKHWKTEQGENPFEQQNSFLKLATGLDTDFFIKEKLYTNGAENCSFTSFENDGDGSYSISVFNEDSAANFKLNFTAESEGNYYLYLGSASHFEKAEIETDNYTKTQELDSNPYILDLGTLKEDEEVKIKTYLDEEKGSGSGYLWAYRFNDEAFEKAYELIHDGGMLKVTKRSETYIKAQLSAKKGEILYTSIPYDEGWTCYVDGIEVSPYKIDDALLGLEVGEGEHTVEFKYFPAGLKTGIIISACTVSFLILFVILKKMLIHFIKRATEPTCC